MITAKIVADSIGPHGKRITSFLLVYPRFIHSELMTHRAFSRNAASSRAIPLSKMINNIRANIAAPIHWGAEQKGMQSGGEIKEKDFAIGIWDAACQDAIKHAVALQGLGVHKSICNRILEPFAHMTTLVTATEYVNFFNLRAHKDAMPEFQELAYQMLDLWVKGKPKEVKEGDWHLPFGDQYLSEGLSNDNLLKICTARAARTSYLTMEGEIAHEKDYELHDRLKDSKHWSPFDHPAQCINTMPGVTYGNYIGWMPYRKMFVDENMTVLTAVPR